MHLEKQTSANDPSLAAVTNISNKVANCGPVIGFPVFTIQFKNMQQNFGSLFSYHSSLSESAPFLTSSANYPVRLCTPV